MNRPVFDIPFLADADYVQFLLENPVEIASLHFRLPGTAGLDNRAQPEGNTTVEQTISWLGEFKEVKKYGLLNSRIYPPELLLDADRITTVTQSLERCLEAGVLDGIIFCDHYLLQRLGDYSPEIASAIEAVPGINMCFDSFDRIAFELSYLDETPFRPPRKLILDRCLNRDLDRLATISRLCRESFPAIRLGVLANEGCLLHCPFKLSHDGYIGLANICGRDHTFGLNQKLGCLRLIDQKPWQLLLSPFIRPEDVELYLYHIDFIKLCGRTLGRDFLIRLVSSYLQRSYSGNLLDLLDAVNHLSQSLYIDNPSLSFDLANMHSMCDRQCAACGFCAEVFESIAHPIPPAIPRQEPAEVT